jgi:TolA-binding protein
MPWRILARFTVNRGALVLFGATGAVVVGLLAGVWHFSKKAEDYRDAATIASQALASEIAQTKHLRSRLEEQNQRIQDLHDEAAEVQRRADARVRALRAQLQRLLEESQDVPSGPEGMNRWLHDLF